MVNIIANFLGIVMGQNVYSDAVVTLVSVLLSVIIVVAIIDMVCNIIISFTGWR